MQNCGIWQVVFILYFVLHRPSYGVTPNKSWQAFISEQWCIWIFSPLLFLRFCNYVQEVVRASFFFFFLVNFDVFKWKWSLGKRFICSLKTNLCCSHLIKEGERMFCLWALNVHLVSWHAEWSLERFKSIVLCQGGYYIYEVEFQICYIKLSIQMIPDRCLCVGIFSRLFLGKIIQQMLFGRKGIGGTR